MGATHLERGEDGKHYSVPGGTAARRRLSKASAPLSALPEQCEPTRLDVSDSKRGAKGREYWCGSPGLFSAERGPRRVSMFRKDSYSSISNYRTNQYRPGGRTQHNSPAKSIHSPPLAHSP